MKAGRQCGNLVHPLVYCPELHFSEFTSAVADMKNSVAVGVEQVDLGPLLGPVWAPEQGRGEKTGEGMALSLVSPQHAIQQEWASTPALESPLGLSLAPPFTPRVKVDPLAQLPGPRGPCLLLSTLGPHWAFLQTLRRWSLRIGGQEGVQRYPPWPPTPRLEWKLMTAFYPQDRDNSPSSCAGLFCRLTHRL